MQKLSAVHPTSDEAEILKVARILLYIKEEAVRHVIILDIRDVWQFMKFLR